MDRVIYRTDKKNATALNHLVQDDTLQIIEDQETRIDAVEYIQG